MLINPIIYKINPLSKQSYNPYKETSSIKSFSNLSSPQLINLINKYLKNCHSLFIMISPSLSIKFNLLNKNLIILSLITIKNYKSNKIFLNLKCNNLLSIKYSSTLTSITNTDQLQQQYILHKYIQISSAMIKPLHILIMLSLLMTHIDMLLKVLFYLFQMHNIFILFC